MVVSRICLGCHLNQRFRTTRLSYLFKTLLLLFIPLTSTPNLWKGLFNVWNPDFANPTDSVGYCSPSISFISLGYQWNYQRQPRLQLDDYQFFLEELLYLAFRATINLYIFLLSTFVDRFVTRGLEGPILISKEEEWLPRLMILTISRLTFQPKYSFHVNLSNDGRLLW